MGEAEEAAWRNRMDCEGTRYPGARTRLIEIQGIASSCQLYLHDTGRWQAIATCYRRRSSYSSNSCGTASKALSDIKKMIA